MSNITLIISSSFVDYWFAYVACALSFGKRASQRGCEGGRRKENGGESGEGGWWTRVGRVLPLGGGRATSGRMGDTSGRRRGWRGAGGAYWGTLGGRSNDELDKMSS